jgi:hypothetical protein
MPKTLPRWKSAVNPSLFPSRYHPKSPSVSRLGKEIVEERNVAAAILAGAVALGLCWIIAAAMH